MKVAFLGLGVMGFPMAGHLAKSGHEVCVYNRTAAKAAQWLEEYPGQSAETPALAVRDCEAVFVCVGNDDDVREVVLGEQGALTAMAASAVLVDQPAHASFHFHEPLPKGNPLRQVNVHRYELR